MRRLLLMGPETDADISYLTHDNLPEIGSNRKDLPGSGIIVLAQKDSGPAHLSLRMRRNPVFRQRPYRSASASFDLLEIAEL